MLFYKVKFFHLLWGARGKVSWLAWLPQPSQNSLNSFQSHKWGAWNDETLKLCDDDKHSHFHSVQNGNWDVFPTQVIYENWDKDEPNNHEEIEHCVMFNRSPQMRWNDLYCEHLLNWICETKKGMINSPFNWNDKHKFKSKLYGFQPIERKKYIWNFSFES